MARMKTVMIRVDEPRLQEARRRHVNISQAARDGIDRALQQADMKKRRAWVEAHLIKPNGQTGARTVREIRDTE